MGGPFHLVLARDNGRPMAWSAREARWRADEVADTELVACIAEQSNLIETCPYWNGPDISRYETVMTVRLVTARLGRAVSSFQIAAQPRQCRSTEYMSTVRLDGLVTFQQLSSASAWPRWPRPPRGGGIGRTTRISTVSFTSLGKGSKLL